MSIQPAQVAKKSLSKVIERFSLKILDEERKDELVNLWILLTSVGFKKSLNFR